MAALTSDTVQAALKMAGEVHAEFAKGSHPSARLLADRAFISTFFGYLGPDMDFATDQERRLFTHLPKQLGLPDPLVPYGHKKVH